ncbi:MAG: thioredoxin [Archangium gephyra]|uniref:Thioredoxin n=1 Tax=Archangium gephyra TaxID=48 RepID=A0A2W5V5U3_9BACT|nr:MAG: thioredoxin [Archangium gephyra]
MKPSVIIALIVGGVVGFAVGSMFNKGGSGTPIAAVAGNNNPSAPNRPAPGAPPADTSVYKVPIDESPIRGPNNALVTIVEFSDYQCPFCSRAHNTILELEKQYEGKIRVVMKQHPLDFHPRAKPAALAALAAGEQGKYWQMHDKLFANQQQLEDATFEGYAKDLGLNVEKWKADMQLPKFQQQIAKETALAMQIGATGTPAFFINGKKISGAQPIDNFKRVIDEELGKAQALVNSGTPADQVYAKTIANGVTSPAPAAAPSPGAPAPAALRKIDVPADSPAKGGKNGAKVTIVEWSDFQCPFCSRVVPTLKQIEDTYGDNVKVVFRHQPLPFHNNAKIAAEASMAANEQGKFWPMHDKLFANAQALDRASLERYAQELGLDVGKFKSALDSGKFTKRVEEDSAAGMAVGANGTPTFFINGREFVGAQPFDAFKNIIDEEIKKADALIAKGIKVQDVYAELQKEAGKAPPPSAPGAAPEAKVVTDLKIDGAPVLGPKNAPVTIVAFSDFQCPFCSRVVPTLHDLEKQYEGKIKVVFKHQPLPFHNNAKIAAAASMAANEQGKFWEMHDKLFANQQALDRPNLERYAQELGLDMGKFKAALDSNKYDAYIQADSAEGMRVGANGTPTFFINGRQVVGAQPIDAFKNVIDDELKKKK